jgi:hypothetical protein
MPEITFRHGVKPNDPNRPRLYFSTFKKPKATPPAFIDYSRIPVIGMLGNDNWGDCVFAGDGHTVEQQTYFGQGVEYQVSESQALAAYSAVTGFNPNAGPPGENPTDNGAEVQQGLDFLRKTGFGGHKIAAFAQLDPRNMNDVKLAVAEFGAVAVGLAFPDSAMTQFNAGQPWDVVAGSPIDGGHRVTLVGYDATYLYVFTWNAVQKVTYAFWNEYIAANGGEAWAHISEDWISAAKGVDPEGIDKYTFGAQFAALTGQANPFPAPAPTPTPTPTPVPPVPAPVGLDPAEQALVTAADRYLKSWFTRKYLVDALHSWLIDKGQ